MAKLAKTYPDPDAHSFFAVGQEFFHDAERQIRIANGVVTNTAYFLIGFALELVLKSYIVHTRIKTSGQVYGHDLSVLWEWATTGPKSPCALPIPDWLIQTNTFHVNFLGRYRPPDVNVFAIPGPDHLLEMAKLVEQVRHLVAS